MSHESLIAYVNGEYVPREQAKISVFDVGFLRGDAVFDTTSAWNGRIFKLSAHLDRLDLSLRAVRIPCPLPLEELRGVIIETARRCGLQNAYIQTIVTRGEPPFGVRDLTQCRAGLIVFVVPYVFILGPEQIRAGGRAVIASTRALPAQCLDPKIKSLSRLHFDLAILQGKAAGVDVSIMLDLDGHVTEGPGFNVFVVRGGEMFSPPEGILMGITRRTVFELAAEHRHAGARGADDRLRPLRGRRGVPDEHRGRHHAARRDRRTADRRWQARPRVPARPRPLLGVARQWPRRDADLSGKCRSGRPALFPSPCSLPLAPAEGEGAG